MTIQRQKFDSHLPLVIDTKRIWHNDVLRPYMRVELNQRVLNSAQVLATLLHIFDQETVRRAMEISEGLFTRIAESVMIDHMREQSLPRPAKDLQVNVLANFINQHCQRIDCPDALRFAHAEATIEKLGLTGELKLAVRKALFDRHGLQYTHITIFHYVD